jgi:hypothetical protein
MTSAGEMRQPVTAKLESTGLGVAAGDSVAVEPGVVPLVPFVLLVPLVPLVELADEAVLDDEWEPEPVLPGDGDDDPLDDGGATAPLVYELPLAE